MRVLTDMANFKLRREVSDDGEAFDDDNAVKLFAGSRIHH